MVRHNHTISKNHFKKNWKDRVKLRQDEEFRKRRRNLKRLRKAVLVAPQPARGPVRPLVQCPSIRYNTKARYGRGFTLAEIIAAGLNKEFAETIGISVDHRRRNKSIEVLQRNVQRLKEYLSRLVLFPKRRRTEAGGPKKVGELTSSAEQYKKCGQHLGPLMPLKVKVKKISKAMTVESALKMTLLAKVARRKHGKKGFLGVPRVTFE